jgi:hypothetical protein
MRCPALAAAEEKSGGALSLELARLDRQSEKIANLSIVSVIIVIVAITFLASQATGYELSTLLFVATPVIYIIEAVVLWKLVDRVRTLRVANRLLGVIEYLEKHPQRWNDLNFRAKVIRRIEGVARTIEKLPRQVGGATSHPWLLARAYGAATSIRELKLWVATPNPFTFTGSSSRSVVGPTPNGEVGDQKGPGTSHILRMSDVQQEEAPGGSTQ